MQMADMETSAAYDCIQKNAATEDNIYELVDVNPEPVKRSSSWSSAEVEIKKREAETKMGSTNYCFNILITTIAVTALLLVLIFLSFFLVHYLSYQQLLETQQSVGIETMQLLLNSSNEQLQLQASELKEAQNFIQSLQLQLNSSNEQLQLQASELKEAQRFIQSLQLQLNSSNEQLQLQASELEEAQHFIQSLQLQLNKTVELRESLENDFHLFIEEQQTNELLTQNRIQGIEQDLDNLFIHSCKDLPQGSTSGYYHIPTNGTGIIHVYCDTSLRDCSCNASGGWMRVANLDMTDPTQQCPDGFRLIDRTELPLRTCGRPNGHRDGCVSTTFPVYGFRYSRVCGRIVGYQFGSPSGFDTGENSIDSDYMAGISLTHGLPRQHIWSFVNAQSELTSNQACPCIPDSTGVLDVPLFVGSDYFCDSAVRGSSTTEGVYHPDDPLWDGQGCGITSTCCEFNNPPWFCKQLPQPTTDDIELRLCENSVSSGDDSPFELIQLYIN